MKIKIIFTIVSTILVLFPTQIIGLELLPRSSLAIDESITKEDNLYSNPEEILITPITVNKEFSLTDTEWYKGIYYYTVDRLGFADMPYHYIVTESGNIFKGNRFGDEKQITLSDFNSNTIIIGYVNKGNSTSIDPRAEQVLKDLILQVGNYNNINPSKTSIRNLRFKRDIDQKTIEVKVEKTFGNWESSVSKLVGSITGFAPTSKEYSANLVETIIPPQEVEPGEEILVSVRLKNTSINGNYADSNSELILTKAGSGSSIFYINNEWISQTQTPIMVQGQTFLPNQESKFDFKVKAPLYIGEVSESFELRTFSGGKIQMNNIDVKINVKRTNRKIVEIKNNPTGFSDIYNQAYASSGTALRATVGERFFLIEENLQTLWAKVDIGNGNSGYIAIWKINYL